jgi:hypothetical protein
MGRKELTSFKRELAVKLLSWEFLEQRLTTIGW